jgi:hypothetical protein
MSLRRVETSKMRWKGWIGFEDSERPYSMSRTLYARVCSYGLSASPVVRSSQVDWKVQQHTVWLKPKRLRSSVFNISENSCVRLAYRSRCGLSAREHAARRQFASFLSRDSHQCNINGKYVNADPLRRISTEVLVRYECSGVSMLPAASGEAVRCVSSE